MKFINYFFLSFVIFLLFGCVSLSAPKTQDDNLFVGIIIHTGEGYQKYSSASVNGTHKSGIEMTIVNVSSKEEYKIRTKKNGLFYINTLPEGTYEVAQFYLKVTNGNSWSDTYSSPSSRWIFNITNGKINNFGVINWDGKFREGTNFKFSQLYNDVLNEFNTQFPKTNWSTREVANLNIEKT